MPYILNFLYLLIIVVASPWLLYSAIRKGKYREGWRAKLLGRVPRRIRNGTCVWLHAVSVGEAKLLESILPRLERRHPDAQFFISVTTKAAFELAKDKYAPRTVFYCPLDFSWAVNQALERICPDVLVLTELELWPNMIRSAKRRDIKVALINGRLSEKSFRGYQRTGPLLAKLLKSIDLIAVQNHQYADRFRSLGARPDAIHVTGSLKFDGVQTDRANPQTLALAKLANIQPGDIVFLAGSTQSPEEEIALKVFEDLRAEYPQLRLVLVPRHPDRFDDVARLLDRSSLDWQRRTQLEQQSPNPQARVLLVDTIGELGAWWGTARIAYVGGSMGRRGGQNMIEPAAYGAAVSFGPKTRNFRDVVEMMLRHDAAIVIHNCDELRAFVTRCLSDEQYSICLGRNASQLIRTQQGAAQHTERLLDWLIPGSSLQQHDRSAA